MTENQIAVTQNNSLAVMPVVDIHAALARYQAMKDFIGGVLHEGVDFGIIPGTGTKKTLLKPGAEKFSFFFGLRPVFVDVSTIEDWTGKEHDGEPFFYYRVRCELYRDGQMVASADGSCNSWEKKYRYRSSSRLCPQCGKPTIITGKAEYGGGYICFAKKGGCGAKFRIGDKSIEDQPVGEVKNPDIAEMVNTILKMAQKRSLIAAILIGANASEWFTQDVEDFVDATFEILPPEKTSTPAQPASPRASIAMPRPEPANPPPPQTIEIRTPDQVLAWINQTAEKWQGKTISDGKRGLIAPTLEACFANGDAANPRHRVLKYLTGHSSLKEIPDNYLIALYQWLNPQKDTGGAWLPLATAVREANQIIAHLNSLDQEELPLEASEPAPEFTPDDYDLSLEEA